MRRKSLIDRVRQRGAVLPTVGIFMVVMVGMAVLGVDLSRLAMTANETQVVVDAGAVAYAKTMLDNKIDQRRDSPFDAADYVVESNWIDGRSPVSADVQYAVGNFDFDSRQFRPGGFPANAVRAIGTATVDNFFAGIFGDPTSSVERAAVAALGAPGALRPTLPIALGDCHFNRFQRTDRCSDLPDLRMVPEHVENSCWTSLGPSSASADETIDILPTECCAGGLCGGGELSPMVSIGERIDVLNGSASKVLAVLEDCVAQGLDEFIIPIVACGKCSQNAPVIGFAKVMLSAVHAKGKRKGIDLEAICNTDAVGGAPGSGTAGGIEVIGLVQ